MEPVSYHHDHTTNRSKLGCQMLQIGFHNGTRFYPLDLGFHSISRWLSFNLSGLESGRSSCCQAGFFASIPTRINSSTCLMYLKIRSSTPVGGVCETLV